MQDSTRASATSGLWWTGVTESELIELVLSNGVPYATTPELRALARHVQLKGRSHLKAAELLEELTRRFATHPPPPPVPLFAELCAGLAAMSLMLQHGRHCKPPVSRMGNKHGYGLAILRVMGLRPGQRADRYLWCEPDPGCRALLTAYTDPALMREAADIIRGWKDEDPRALWERLRAEGPIRDFGAREVARWATVQRWGYANAPLDIDLNIAARDGEGTFGANNFGTTATTANGMDRILGLPATIAPDAREIHPPTLPPGCVAYMDPPYVNTTGYGNDLPREDVCELAERWASAGAAVYISEAEPLSELDGWHTVEITSTRVGQKRTFSKQKREWLTMNRKPAWVPAVQ